MLDIQLDEAFGLKVCRPIGELDAFTVSQFRQALAELATSPRLLIDMSAVPFVDSAGLGALIGGVRRGPGAGGGRGRGCHPPTPPPPLRTPGFGRLLTVAPAVGKA